MKEAADPPKGQHTPASQPEEAHLVPHAIQVKRSASLLLALAIALTSFVAISQPAKAAPKAPYSYGALVDPLARYAAQTKCSPSAKPGTSALSKMLLSTYKGSRSLGIVRACSVGGTSEHKEGRAFDWGLSAYSARDRAYAADFIKWALATDRHGNKYANLRRLGIQYMIWNKRIWSTSYASSGWRAYKGVSPHTDHIHISLGWDGANKQTSFWTNKVAGKATTASKPAPPKPAPTPTPTPTPAPKPAARKTLPVPAKPATLLTGPTLDNETVTLPANAAAGVTTRGALVKGQKYLVEYSGTFAYAKAAGYVADAECSAVAGSTTWKNKRSLSGSVPNEDHLDVYLNGVDLNMNPDTDTGDRCDARNHVYRVLWAADRSGRANFRIWEPNPVTPSDNSGALTVRVQRLVTPDVMTWTVPTTKAAGVESPGAVVPGATYLATVSGTWKTGAFTADAECSIAPGDSVWRRYRTVGAAGDLLDALVDRKDVSGSAVVPPTSGDNCDGASHRYQFTYKASLTKTVNVRVATATTHAANSGSLTVRLQRVLPVRGAETVKVDSFRSTGVTTSRVYEAGKPLLLRVSGSYTLGNGYTADAECTTGRYDASWRSNRAELRNDRRISYGDATVNGTAPTWVPASGSGNCDSSRHTYTYRYTPTKTGVIHLGVADTDYTDNSGLLTLTVEPTK
jgi:hypothetical protein